MTAAVSPARRPVSAEDLLRLRWPLEPALRSDGRAVAYVVSGLGEVSDALVYDVILEELDADGVPEGPSRRLEGCRTPKWSADGAVLACVRTTGVPGVVVVEASGCTTRFVGPVVDFDVSPDGTHLAVISAPGVVAVVEVASGIRVERAGPDGATMVRWSPDGTALAVVGGTSGLDERPLVSTITRIELDGPGTHGWLTWDGPIRNVQWAPDGSALAVVGHNRGPAGWEPEGVWLLPTGSGAPYELTAGCDRWFGRAVRGDDERSLGRAPLEWSSDGGSVLTTVVDGGRSGLVRVGADGALSAVATGDRAILEVSVARSGVADVLAFTWSDPANPGELSLSSCGVERQLTHVNTAWLAEVALAPTVAVWARAEPDAPSVDGWLTAGPGTGRPAPLVVQVHGGPHHPVGWRFSFDAQRLAALGLAVLRTNPRGSTGRGRAFAQAVAGDWGGPDLRDLLAAAEVAAGEPTVDEDRVAIVGESYGGFMAAWAVATTDRFAAAIAENAISDPLALASGPRGPNFWWIEFGASPQEDSERYRARSTLDCAARIVTPLLLIHAEDDENVLIEQSERLHRRLSSLGRPVWFERVPGEGHMVNVFGRPSRRLRRIAALDEFLLEHLRPDDGPLRPDVQPAGVDQ